MSELNTLSFSNLSLNLSLSLPHEPELPTVTIQNVVSTVNLKCKLDLRTIAEKARNAEYNPRRFSAVIMRMREPRATGLIFASGKMVITGSKSAEESLLSARKIARVISKLGFQVTFSDFRIQNVVATSDLKMKLNLCAIATSDHAKYVNFEPEIFPGLNYSMIKPRATVLVFTSGKIVITGTKDAESVRSVFDNIFPILKSFSIVAKL